MGIFYKTMIKEILSEQKASGQDLETFLKVNEVELKAKYRLPDLLFYLNITELFRLEEKTSEYFTLKLFEEEKAHEAFSTTQSFKICSSDNVECTCRKVK